MPSDEVVDYLIKSYDDPVAVHVFNEKIVIVEPDGTVSTVKRVSNQKG